VVLDNVGEGQFDNRIRNLEDLCTVKEERNILRTTKRRNVNRIGHIRRRNCLLKHLILSFLFAGKIEARIYVMGRRGERRRQLQDNFKENRGCWKLIAFFGKPTLEEAMSLW
jgi:hypothetical protein